MSDISITIEEDQDWGYWLYSEPDHDLVGFCATRIGARWKAARILRRLRAGLHTESVR